MSFRPDIFIDLSFPIADPDALVIKTNAKPEVVEEILVDWTHFQVGQGSDASVAVERAVYNIKIGLRLEDDAFGTESNTGNKGLTTGIVLATIGRLNAGKGTIQDLA